jgi:hypothetical protein
VAVPRIPSSWIEGVACLVNRRPPTDIPAHQWRQFLGDCNNFLASGGTWAERAAALGWDALALFGCRRHRPLVHRGSAGLLWAINGGRLVELCRDWAVFELAENGSRRIFERRRVDAANVRLPWIGRLQMFQRFDDMQQVSKVNIDATMRSFEVTAKSVRAITTEIADYTRRSFENSTKTFEKLLGAKSLDKVVEVQSEFAKAAYEDYIAQAAKLGKIYSELGKEAFKSYDGVTAKSPTT